MTPFLHEAVQILEEIMDDGDGDTCPDCDYIKGI